MVDMFVFCFFCFFCLFVFAASHRYLLATVVNPPGEPRAAALLTRQTLTLVVGSTDMPQTLDDVIERSNIARGLHAKLKDSAATGGGRERGHTHADGGSLLSRRSDDVYDSRDVSSRSKQGGSQSGGSAVRRGGNHVSSGQTSGGSGQSGGGSGGQSGDVGGGGGIGAGGGGVSGNGVVDDSDVFRPTVVLEGSDPSDAVAAVRSLATAQRRVLRVLRAGENHKSALKATVYSSSRLLPVQLSLHFSIPQYDRMCNNDYLFRDLPRALTMNTN
jgi:hypothetical protein